MAGLNAAAWVRANLSWKMRFRTISNVPVESLKNRIWSLFQPKLRKHADSIKHTDLISKIEEGRDSKSIGRHLKDLKGIEDVNYTNCETCFIREILLIWMSKNFAGSLNQHYLDGSYFSFS
ncbi:hypothetical protein P8452_35161 [Trifolium repens]|nr:hypothetical protein P8452_35161 [Trifolium repens]